MSAHSFEPSVDQPHPIEAMLEQVTGGRDTLPPGTTVGSFVIKQLLWRDEVRACYLATASASSSDVCVEEFLPSGVAARGEDGNVGPRSPAQAEFFAAGVKAFMEESEQLSRLGHASLMRVSPAWKARGTVFRLRPRVDRTTVADWRRSLSEPPSEEALLALLTPLLEALQVVHEAGVVHGNVRPESVALRSDGMPTLLDRAAPLAAMRALSPSLTLGISTEYLAPELLDPHSGLEPGPWSDLYSWASLAQFCITGEAPIDASLRGQGMVAPRLADQLAELRRRHPKLRYRDSLVNALDRAMSLDPGLRQQSVTELRRELEASAWIASVTAIPEREPTWARDESRGVAAAMSVSAGMPPRRVPTLEPNTLSSALDMVVPASERPAPRRPAARSGSRWPWAVGGVLAGAALAVAVVFGLQYYKDDARMAAMASGGFGGSSSGAAGGAATPSVESALQRANEILANLPPLPAATQGSGARGDSSVPSAGDAGQGQAGGSSATLGGTAAADADGTAGAAGGALTGRELPPAGGGVRDTLPADTAAATGARQAPAPTVPAETAPAPIAPTAPTTPAAQPVPQAAPATRQVAPAPAAGTRQAAPSDEVIEEAPPARAPARAAPPAREQRAAAPAEPPAPSSPLAACSPRTNFALYRCMETECERARFVTHPQCIRFRLTDEVPQ